MKRWRMVALAALMIVGLAACASSPSDEVTVCRNGGMFDNKNVRNIINPGNGPNFEGWATDCHSFPVSTRIYTASDDPGADGGPLTCTTSDAVRIKMAVSVRFTLNTESHDLIRDEYNAVLRRYGAWDDDGWDNMLRDTIRRELDSQVEQTCRDYTGREMATEAAALTDVQAALRSDLRDRINDNVGTTLFCGPGVPYGDSACPELTVSVTRIIPEEVATRDAFEALVREEANTRAARQAVQTAEANADSIRAQAQAAADAGPNYVNLRLIQLCEDHPSACPTLWVLPSEGGPQITTSAPS